MLALFYSKGERRFTRFADWMFFVSCIFTTILFSMYGSDVVVVIGTVVSAGISFYLFILKKIQNKVFENFNKKVLLLSIVLAFFSEVYFCKVFYDYNPLLLRVFQYLHFEQYVNIKFLSLTITFLVALLAFVVIVTCFYFSYMFFLNIFIKAYKSLNKVEKYSFLISSVIFSLLIIVTYLLTYVFWGTQEFKGFEYGYDIIYTTDTGNNFSYNSYLNISAPVNDIKQPLFGVFAVPFVAIPYAISTVLFFIPNLYAFLVAIEQVLVLLITVLIVVKMIDLNRIAEVLVYGIFALSFPTLLFALNLEQYVFPVFWVVLLIYSYKNKMAYNDEFFVASTGSLLTSGVLLPLLYNRENKLKENALHIIKVLLAFLAVCFIFGKGCYIIDIVGGIDTWLGFTGKDLGIVECLQQYSVFVRSCFIYPASVIADEKIALAAVNSFNPVGIILFALSIVSFVLNRKKVFAKISFAWVCFSFVLLGIVGWGAPENGMVLYSLYFWWAFIALLVMLIEKLPHKLNILKYIIYSVSIIVLICFNIPGIIEIIRFGITYYPMV